MTIENTKAQMRKGVLELCVLAIVSEEEAYPSDIIEKLKSQKLIVVEGTLYPLLNRLKESSQSMKRVININLGGLPFIIDEDAYEYMENYLNSIRKHFSFSESKDEIMYDIEMRMSELGFIRFKD